MTSSRPGRSPFRRPLIPIIFIVSAVLVMAAPAWAGDPGDDGWRIDILAQSDSRAELRPCT